MVAASRRSETTTMPTRALTVAPALATFRAQLDAWRTGQVSAIAQRVETALVEHVSAKADQIIRELRDA